MTHDIKSKKNSEPIGSLKNDDQSCEDSMRSNQPFTTKDKKEKKI